MRLHVRAVFDLRLSIPLITQMLAHPALIQRPIVVGDELALLARPVERVLELL